MSDGDDADETDDSGAAGDGKKPDESEPTTDVEADAETSEDADAESEVEAEGEDVEAEDEDVEAEDEDADAESEVEAEGEDVEAEAEDADAESGDEAEDAEPEEGATEDEQEDTEGEQGDTEVEELVSVETIEERLSEAEEELEAAETEADLDAVEATLDEVAAAVEAADLPEPDEDDEDAENPRAELESTLEELRGSLEEQRGPYGEDVVAAIDEAKSTIEDTRWTERGEDEIVEAVEAFAADVSETLDDDFAPEGDDREALHAALDSVAEAVAAAEFDADEDEEAIAALLEATDALSAGLEDAQEWDDLMVHEQLAAQGFYDPLGHYKDFPPEWSALKEWEKRGNAEMILLALDTFDSGFMEEHCLEALTRMGDPAAFDEMHGRAQKRGKPAIKALGKMGTGAEGAVETLVEYVDADSDPQLQKVTFKALGEIGSEEATQPLADKLVMENDQVRPHAARALGLLGDTRAVKPLGETLADDDSDKVRAAAAWALRQIGTESALEAAAAYTDDRAFAVQHEAELAAEALGGADDDGDADPDSDTEATAA
jgi:hypothetical protein